ncbi:MAG: hypothetical protein K8J08_12380 [Thermoanaerobaculia bacterium]|nr:hypothetical protein [Thermoanaerobaculia bacterium]
MDRKCSSRRILSRKSHLGPESLQGAIWQGAVRLGAVLALIVTTGPLIAGPVPPALQDAEAGQFLPESAAEIFERSTGEMAGRLSTLDLGPDKDYPTLLKAAQRSFVALAERMNFWGPDRLAALAPSLEFLSLPSTADPYLEAAARFDACKVYLQSDFDDPSSATVSDAQRLTAAMGTVYLDAASWFLHNSYLVSGGRAEDADRFFASPQLASSRARLASDLELQKQSRQQCAPVLEALFGANPFDDPPDSQTKAGAREEKVDR